MAVLAGCGGGGSGATTEELDSGPPPHVGANATRGLIERQIERRNQVSQLDCYKATGKPADSELDLWNCKVRLTKFENDGGEIQIVVSGGNARYVISKCTFAPIRVITSAQSVPKVPDICKLIH